MRISEYSIFNLVYWVLNSHNHKKQNGKSLLVISDQYCYVQDTMYNCSVFTVYTQTNPHYHCGYGVVNAIYLQTLLSKGRRCQDRYLPIVISNQTTAEYWQKLCIFNSENMHQAHLLPSIKMLFVNCGPVSNAKPSYAVHLPLKRAFLKVWQDWRHHHKVFIIVLKP